MNERTAAIDAADMATDVQLHCSGQRGIQRGACAWEPVVFYRHWGEQVGMCLACLRDEGSLFLAGAAEFGAKIEVAPEQSRKLVAQLALIELAAAAWVG
jgi:hypothetical protein